jgi:hypothetical protein
MKQIIKLFVIVSILKLSLSENIRSKKSLGENSETNPNSESIQPLSYQSSIFYIRVHF